MKLKERLDQLQPPTKRVEFKPTEDLPEQMAKVIKKELLKQQIKNIWKEIESL
jgi:hypothetical protein